MNIQWDSIPQPADVTGWREWDRTEFFTYNRAVQCKPNRSPSLVNARNIRVSYGEDEEFGIRVFEPQEEFEGSRPAIIMYHGGGWSHDDPTNDEGL